MVSKKMRGREGPMRCIAAVEGATNLEFDEGLKNERKLFIECHDSEESTSLIHMFFSERGATKIPDVPKETQTREVNSAAVLGCGTMGGGIAMSFANAKIPVTIIETNKEALEKGMNIIEKNYRNTVSKGRLSQEEMDKRLALIDGTTEWNAISNTDMIVEAVFEEMELKKEIFSKIDKLAKPDAILASNTSTLDIDAIASATNRPENVIGTHFFSPANVMQLLEVVRGDNTSKEIIASTMALGKKIKKSPVLAGNCDGFIGNRMFHDYVRQAHALAEEGASVARIDKVIYDFGWAMGPFAVNDLAGNDVGWRIRKRHKTEGKYNNLRYTSTVADQLSEIGRYGQKTGRGFYIYDPNTRAASNDPEVDEMFTKIAKEKGIVQRDISDEEILNRLSWSLVNTGAMILEEGYALRASDLDIVYIHVEAPDEAGHNGDALLKQQAVEDFDRLVVGPLLEGVEHFGEYRLLMTPDHRTPIALRTHSREPVPFVLWGSGWTPDQLTAYNETAAEAGGLQLDHGYELMEYLLGKKTV